MDDLEDIKEAIHYLLDKVITISKYLGIIAFGLSIGLMILFSFIGYSELHGIVLNGLFVGIFLLIVGLIGERLLSELI